MLYSTQICGDMNVGGDGGRMKIVLWLRDKGTEGQPDLTGSLEHNKA